MLLDLTDALMKLTIEKEKNRQAQGLELIPSENYVSQPVLDALGSVFTNKYSEGYPGRRYYGGQDFTDIAETKAIERACKLFHCKYANVQPLSGAMANIAMYFALLEPGDTVLGMDLSHGGHLTHGHPVTYMTKIFKFIRYQVKDLETGEIDYEGLRQTALIEKPKIILAGFSAYSRNLDYKKFVEIAHEVGALAVADVAHIAGLIAGGALENPLDVGFNILTMTTHKTLRGPRGGMIVTNDETLAKKIDKAVFPGLQGGPHMNVIAAKAVAFKEALSPGYKRYCKQVLKNAKAMENEFRRRGVKMVFGGTDNHLLLLDVFGSMGISGKEAETKLDLIGITANRNMIPNDTRKPMDPSGLRLGTPAITTRGFNEHDCEILASVIVDMLLDKTGKQERALHGVVNLLAETHPVPMHFIHE
jgi:glycine hydroxymethyltransferase